MATRVRLCAPGWAGWPAGCALGAPSLFLDSILFLSHCLDIVHEHRSSQKKFEFFLIKSNKMGQNFEKKMKFSKIKFLWKK